ncbi:hypothetical protein VNO78_24831 [Psophocarpus tetragonolobus]|uniref:Secreted protein n=1 Tax=Psophocarpus tetragonolobus TaxID=3891 RepID=A0AAN9S4V8_PSOTE
MGSSSLHVLCDMSWFRVAVLLSQCCRSVPSTQDKLQISDPSAVRYKEFVNILVGYLDILRWRFDSYRGG